MMSFGMLSIAVLFLKVEPVDLLKTALGLSEDMSKKDDPQTVETFVVSAVEPD